MSSGNLSIRRKRNARIAAIQALYNRSILNSTLAPEKLAAQITEQWRDSIATGEAEWPSDELPEAALLTELISGVSEQQERIDTVMRGIIKENWKPERMSPVMLSVLRCAIYELGERQDRDAAIILDEYVTIASGFFDDPELGFIHSALQRLAGDLRKTE